MKIRPKLAKQIYNYFIELNNLEEQELYLKFLYDSGFTYKNFKTIFKISIYEIISYFESKNLKYCSYHKRVESRNLFKTDNSNIDRLKTRCDIADKICQKERRIARKDEFREYWKNWRIKNREKSNSYVEKWRKNNPEKFKKITKTSNRKKYYKNREKYKKNFREYDRKRMSIYSKYYKLIKKYEEIQVDPNNPKLVQIKCTYCGRWFNPTNLQVRMRLKAIYGKTKTLGYENRLYCSDDCKKLCPTYGRKYYPKGFKPATSREVQPSLRKMVLERDSWTCQKCGSTESLHCHHITGVEKNPIESADIDNCITLCKKCHKEVHKLPDCGYNDLRCKK